MKLARMPKRMPTMMRVRAERSDLHCKYAWIWVGLECDEDGGDDDLDGPKTGEMKCWGVCHLWSLSWKKLLCVLVITLLSEPMNGRHLKTATCTFPGIFIVTRIRLFCCNEVFPSASVLVALEEA